MYGLMTPENAIYLVWIVWALSWLAAAIWSSRAAARPSFGSEFGYRLLTSAGLIMIFLTGRQGGLSARLHHRFPGLHMAWIRPLWATPDAIGWGLAAVAIAGFAFAWWARIHLGALWSGSITRKADHHVVDTGPYAIVRHPIYTGLIAAAIPMVIIKASFAAMIGLVLMTIGYWLKAKMEEGFLRQELGAEAYDAYKKRVPMLVPFFPV